MVSRCNLGMWGRGITPGCGPCRRVPKPDDGRVHTNETQQPNSLVITSCNFQHVLTTCAHTAKDGLAVDGHFSILIVLPS